MTSKTISVKTNTSEECGIIYAEMRREAQFRLCGMECRTQVIDKDTAIDIASTEQSAATTSSKSNTLV